MIYRNNTIVSIGLNVGETEPVSQLSRTLLYTALRAQVRGIVLFTSEWQGASERCVQFAVEPHDQPDGHWRTLAAALDQTAIAVLSPGEERWTLHFANGDVTAGDSIEVYPVRVNKYDQDFALQFIAVPEQVAPILRAAAQAYHESASELASAWQDKRAGHVWTRLAVLLERAADGADLIVAETV